MAKNQSQAKTATAHTRALPLVPRASLSQLPGMKVLVLPRLLLTPRLGVWRARPPSSPTCQVHCHMIPPGRLSN